MGLEGCDTTDSVLGVCVGAGTFHTNGINSLHYIPNQIWSIVLKTMITTGSPQKLWLRSSWGQEH